MEQPIWASLELWLLIALILLVVAIFKPLRQMVVGALDGHGDKIRAELDEARRLREEAQSLLAEHQRQLEGGQDQAKAIVEHAHTEAERMTERHRAELDASLQRRTEQALVRISQEEARAIQDVRAHAANLAIRTTERLLADRLDDKQTQTLLDDAIEEVGRKLN